VTENRRSLAIPDLPDGRGAIPMLHQHLRECVLDGRLAPGQPISQVELAQQLGVSRTPLREALRMLQEEGLVDAETNQRMRVSPFDPSQLDADYACRILLESLAADITAPSLVGAKLDELDGLLEAMESAGAASDTEAWIMHHSTFHGTLTGGANGLLLKQLRSYADRSVRYIRIYRPAEPRAWTASGHDEHVGVVEAVRQRDVAELRSLLATHLARTALRVLADFAPSYEPTAVRRSLAIVANERATTGR